MEHIQIIKGLERKSDEITTWLADYGKQAQKKETDLVHLRYTIALMKPNRGSTPTPSSMSVARIFKRGEPYERCVLFPRPRNWTQLATACMIAKDLEPSDQALRRAMSQQIIQVLHVRKGEGRIISTGKRGVTRVWALARGSGAQNGKAI